MPGFHGGDAIRQSSTAESLSSADRGDVDPVDSAIANFGHADVDPVDPATAFFFRVLPG